MVERKGNLDETRKVIKIPGELHRSIDIESAMRQTPMYVLIQRAWDAYQGREEVASDPLAEIEAGLTPRQVKLLRRYADLLRSGRDPKLATVVETVLDRSESSPKTEEYQNKKTG